MMLRVIISLILLTSLAACSAKKEAEPLCQYTSKSQIDLRFSTLPDQFNIPLQQEKLTELMWAAPEDGECFVRRNGTIQLYLADGHSTPEYIPFRKLKKAPKKARENWSSQESAISTTLMGLTTFRFYEEPKEVIIETEILLSPDARPWHLWHEYAHYIIGKNRVDSPQQKINVPQEADVEKALQLAFQETQNQDEFLKKFQVFSRQQIDFLQKKYLDEIVIELTLQELTQQAPELLPIIALDTLMSQQVVAYFYENYLFYIEIQKQDLKSRSQSLPSEWLEPVQSHIDNLNEQKKTLKQLLKIKPVLPE